MRLRLSLCICFVMLVFIIACTERRSKTENEQPPHVSEKFEYLRFSEVLPTGWLKMQMADDMKGFVGHLDSIVPDLILKDDIYGANRLSKNVKRKEVGAITDDGLWQPQFLWWNSETQSNWWDGYIRNAILMNSAYHLAKSKAHIDRILETQDDDGYLGIYDRELRYKFDNENGELWAKATLLRGMLAWYEYTHDKQVLISIERAARNVMQNYPAGSSHPFYSTNPDASGLTHGLMITDIFERLHQLTGEKIYNEYCVFLYRDFSQSNLSEDAQVKKLLDSAYRLRAHGVHTYEHLRGLSAATHASNDEELVKALTAFLEKIQSATTPSGGPIGDEWIGGRLADATNTGYEYCSTHELMHSYISLLAKSGDTRYAEKVERLFFNAAQGARNPRHSAIAYLKTDNSFAMTGPKNDDTTQPKQTRYKYSPSHQDAAVCCVPNAGRITPYYIQSMWMKDKDGLVATLLGPSEVKTVVNGDEVSIKEITNYPYQNAFRFIVEKGNKKPLTIKIRKPAWVHKVVSSLAFAEQEGFLVFAIENQAAEFELTFVTDVERHVFKENETYFTHGALVYALPIAHEEKISKDFAVQGFHDYTYSPMEVAKFKIASDADLQVMGENVYCNFWNEKSRKRERRELLPMGRTILRQVTFPIE